MKKFVVLTLFGLLIMAFGATVYAQKLEFKASGTIDWDTVWERNVPFYFGAVSASQTAHVGLFQTYTTPAFYPSTFPVVGARGTKTGALDRPAAYSYSRGVLKFDAVMDKNLSGSFIFEIDALRWGQNTVGTLSQASFRNNMGAWATDQAAIEVKNVYIDVGLPYFGIPVPMTVRIGAQPFGVRPNMVVYTDGMGVTGGLQAGPVTIIPMWAKILEGTDFASDDADMYGLHVNAKIGTFTIGGYGLYYNMNTYPFQFQVAQAWGTVGGVAASTSASYGVVVNGTQMADFWWWGAYVDGKAGPVNINLDFVYDTGKVRQKLPTYAAASTTALSFNNSVPNVKYSGWAGRAKVDFPWEKFNFGVVGMYASGVDADKTSTSGLPGTTVAQPYLAGIGQVSRKVRGYVVPPGSEQSPSSQESIVMYSCFNAAADGGTGIAQEGNYQQVSRGAFGGTWFAKLYGSAKLLPWYKVTLQGLYIGDTTKNGNTLGTARKNPFVPAVNQVLRDDKTIGWELDLINEIQIYKNLTWFVGGGVLFAGDALDAFNGVNGPGGANVSPKTPWNITTRLLYAF
jgi:hypothetical protein